MTTGEIYLAAKDYACLCADKVADVIEVVLLVQYLLNLNESADVTPDTLYNRGKTFYRFGPASPIQLVKIALLCEIAEELDESAITDGWTLLQTGKCHACFIAKPPIQTIELMLLDQISNTA